jgi:hypothetical protein
MTLPISAPDLLSNFQSPNSSDLSNSSYLQESSKTSFPVSSLAASTSLPPVPTAKLEISASLSFECPKCPKTFAFQSQLRYFQRRALRNSLLIVQQEAHGHSQHLCVHIRRMPPRIQRHSRTRSTHGLLS